MIRSTRIGALVALAGAVTVLGHSPSVQAKAAGAAPKATEASRAELEGLKKQLAGSEEQILAGLKAIEDGELVAAAPVVSDLLARGGNEAVLEAALKTAGKLKAESLSAAVAPYAQHRSEEVRRQAVRALLKTKGPVAVQSLEKALRSPDAVVRGTAATGLGSLGAREALPDLFRALDHGVPEAAAAIGQLCTPEECEKFAEETGRIAFDIMITGFDQVLFRPPQDVPDDAKVKLVGRLRELGTPEAGKYLADVGERWPKDWSKRVKQAIDSAARAVGGGSKK
jgi:HEAT repeat protein